MALMAAVMPGFGDPRAMPIDDFRALMEQCRYVIAVSSGRPLEMSEALELEDG